MGKLLGMLMTLMGAISTATVIAAVVLILYYAQTWKVTNERLSQAVAILQGKGVESLLPPPPPKKEADGEQPDFTQLLEARGLKARDLEQREMALRANLRQFQEELDKIAAEKKRVQTARNELQAKLDEIANNATSAGTENVTTTVQTLKPKQAKELLVQRLEKGDIDVVAGMLMSMTDSKRAKIIAEFKTPAEMDQIGEVLNRIRQGQPAAGAVGDAGRKIQPPKGPGA